MDQPHNTGEQAISHWHERGSAPRLDPDIVHVWRAPLDVPSERAERIRDLLSPDEQIQADRFASPAHRIRFIVAHGALRRLIADYENLSAFDQPFAKRPRGKPEIPDSASLRFNLAHSDDLAVMAFARGHEVGIDVERIHERVDVERLARRFFSTAELTALLELPAEHRRESFFHMWVQKEAYMKGRGDGVLLGVTHFDVVTHPDLPAALLNDRRDPEAPGRWTLSTLEPKAGFRGALAVEGRPTRVEYFSWP